MTPVLMSDQTDFQLLQEYFDHHSQPAFAELVHRYINLVYSSALRQVRDPHAAEDVTQTVFIVLAQKGRQIKATAVVAGWLLGVTRFAARDHLKRARRRRHYEHAAALERTAAMVSAQNQDSPGSDTTEASDAHTQEQLAFVLDDALAKLGGAARDAMVLRFFQNQSFAQVGQRLGITEVAARQRVFRSLEKLRSILSGHGLTLGGESLAVALAATAVLPAPPSLSASVAAIATSGSAAATCAPLLKGTVTLMKLSKAKTAVVTALLLLLLVALAGFAVINWPSSAQRQVVVNQTSTTRSTPNGDPNKIRPVLRDIVPPENFQPPSFGWRTPAPWETPLATPMPPPYAGPPITGTVLSPEGQPLAGAQVLLLGSMMPRPQEIRRGPASVDIGVITRADGRFALSPARQPKGLFIKSPQGFAWIQATSIKPEQTITLTRWSRLEITVRKGIKPLNQAQVDIYPAAFGDMQGAMGHVAALADQDGRATIEQVFPGENRLTWVEVPTTAARQRDQQSNKTPLPPREIRVNVAAGQIQKVSLGGVGRPVTGTIDGDLRDFDYRRGVLRSTNESIHFDAKSNGSFILTDVPPGDYELLIDLGITWGKNIKSVETYAVARTTFKMPPVPGGFSEEPLDIGKVPMTDKKILEVGQPFAKLAGKTPKDEPISLDNFRGKILLVEVSNPSESRSRGEIEWQHSLHSHFGANPAFAMVTVTSGSDAVVPWPVMRVERLPDELQGSSAAMYLLDADGTLVAKNITAAQAYSVLDKALQATPDPRVKFDYVDRQAARSNAPYTNIPAVSAADAAAGAPVTLVAGVPSWDTPRSDSNVLTDGRMLPNEDAPAEALFFQAGSLEGRFRLDLKQPTNVGEIRTYSWHKDTRGAQVFRVFGSDGTAENFNLAPGIGIDPTQCGWKSIAFVDTRPDMKPIGVQGVAEGGRYVSLIADKERGSLGAYRHLLFQVFVTESDDVFGHTFYGEVDVIPAGPAVPDTKAASASQKSTGP